MILSDEMGGLARGDGDCGKRGLRPRSEGGEEESDVPLNVGSGGEVLLELLNVWRMKSATCRIQTGKGERGTYQRKPLLKSKRWEMGCRREVGLNEKYQAPAQANFSNSALSQAAPPDRGQHSLLSLLFLPPSSSNQPNS